MCGSPCTTARPRLHLGPRVRVRAGPGPAVRSTFSLSVRSAGCAAGALVSGPRGPPAGAPCLDAPVPVPWAPGAGLWVPFTWSIIGWLMRSFRGWQSHIWQDYPAGVGHVEGLVEVYSTEIGLVEVRIGYHGGLSGSCNDCRA